MIREICKDEAFLAQRAEPATPDDLQVAADLLETLEHHKAGCVGMAANMIGVAKRIIVFSNEGTPTLLFNPNTVCAHHHNHGEEHHCGEHHSGHCAHGHCGE